MIDSNNFESDNKIDVDVIDCKDPEESKRHASQTISNKGIELSMMVTPYVSKRLPPPENNAV